MHPGWIYRRLGSDRHLLERVRPDGSTLALEVLDGAGVAPTFAIARLHAPGGDPRGVVLGAYEAGEV